MNCDPTFLITATRGLLMVMVAMMTSVSLHGEDRALQRGIKAERIGDNIVALDSYNEAIRLNPDDTKAYWRRAMFYEAHRDYDKAIADYSVIVRLDPKDADAYVQRACSYGRENISKALADYGKAIRVDPARAKFFHGHRGDLYLYKGDYEEASKEFSESLRLDPNQSFVFRKRAKAYMASRAYEKAIVDFRAEIMLRPTEVSLYRELAWMLATSSKPGLRNGQMAVEYARKACELDEWKDPVNFYALAAAYAEAGDFEQAVQYEKKFLESNVSEVGGLNLDIRERLKLYEAHKPYRAPWSAIVSQEDRDKADYVKPPKWTEPVGTYLEKHDTDRDGVIIRREFPGSAADFKKWDKNNDGKLNKEELNLMLSEH